MSDTDKRRLIERFVRVPEIASLLGCGERLVWAYLAEGRLPRRKHPASKRITGCLLSDVQSFLDQMKVQNGSLS